MERPENSPRKMLDELKQDLWFELHKKLKLGKPLDMPQFIEYPPNPGLPFLSYEIEKKRIGITQDFDIKIIEKCNELKLPLSKIFSKSFNDHEIICAICKNCLSHEYLHAIHHQIIGSTFDEWEKEKVTLSASTIGDEKLAFFKHIAWQEGLATAVATIIFAESLDIDKTDFWNNFWKRLFINQKVPLTEQGLYMILYGIGANYFLNEERAERIIEYLKLPAPAFPSTIDREILEWPN